MLNIDELIKLASDGAEMPDGLKQPEQNLFVALRYIYADHKRNIIDDETGAREKRRVLQEYESAKFNHKLSKSTANMYNKLSYTLIETRNNRCPSCQKIVDILHGFIK